LLGARRGRNAKCSRAGVERGEDRVQAWSDRRHVWSKLPSFSQGALDVSVSTSWCRMVVLAAPL